MPKIIFSRLKSTLQLTTHIRMSRLRYLDDGAADGACDGDAGVAFCGAI